MLVYVVILAIIFLVSFITLFVQNKNGGQMMNMRVVLFFLLFAVIMSACGFLGKVSSATDSMTWFFILQVVFFGLGYLVSYLLKKNFWG